MKTRALAALLPLLALAGCTADNNVSIQVFSLCAPPENSCRFDATCEAQFLGVNAMDRALTNTFWTFIEVHNQLLPNGDDTVGRPNTHDAYVEEYTIDYDVTGGTSPASITRRVAAGPAVVPASGTAVVGVIAVPADVGAQLAAGSQVVARVRLRGLLADQTTWETAEFPIPVQVCSGCVGLPAPCDDAAQTLYACPQFGQSPATYFCE